MSGLPNYLDKSDTKGRLWDGSNDSSSLEIFYSSPFKNRFPINYSGPFLKTAALVSVRVSLVGLK